MKERYEQIIDNPELNNKNRKQFARWIILAICIMVAAYFISNYWVQLLLIQGNSMSPTYHNMQLTLLNRYDKNYEPGDVIAFRCKSLDAVLVKRIVACEGDTILISNRKLYINNVIYDFYADATFDYAGLATEELTLQNGEYFVVGDNVAESKDSRYDEVGIIETDDIIGRIVGETVSANS